jgi:GTP-binding protein
MPQTKFVLKKAIERGLKPIVVINKIDKPTARPHRVVDQVFDLFFHLGASNEQADFPLIYASAKNGYALTDIDSFDPHNPPSHITPLLDEIIRIIPPAPDYNDKPTKMQIVNLGYDDYVGRLGIGRLYEGTLSP